MALEEFILTVKKMRLAQMRFSKTGDKTDMAASKGLERQVDSFLVEWQAKRLRAEIDSSK